MPSSGIRRWEAASASISADVHAPRFSTGEAAPVRILLGILDPRLTHGSDMYEMMVLDDRAWLYISLVRLATDVYLFRSDRLRMELRALHHPRSNEPAAPFLVVRR